MGEPDEEVTFPRFDTSPIGHQPENSTRLPPTLSLVGDLPFEDVSRVDRLETEFSEVKSQVANMNTKLDMLVSATCQGTVTKDDRQPPRDHTTEEHIDIPSPQRLRREQNHDGYVDRVMRQEYFAPPQAQGKKPLSDIECEQNTRKPYMYIERESCQTEKQKLDVRCDISPLEYTNALVKLLLDTRAYHPDDLPHILRHLRDVTHDARERPWSAVRRWSHAVFDAVERGDIMWQDHQEIQNYRVCIALTAAHKADSHAVKTSVDKEYLCRDFNSRGGCQQRHDHMDGNVKVLHLCAFCDALSQQCVHSVIACERKFMFPSNRQQRQPPAHMPQQWRPQQQDPFTQFPAQSKNGMQAPRLY